ncbi:energy transducer TonB [Psychroserpens damuponensis]|uniref:energy transducer TonB n=1 Tax=Psychroserpens damuponensis TaxID=943936 RepID=UPI0006939500|nr:energy transducer TonB [Psychroserpens damuponensis]
MKDFKKSHDIAGQSNKNVQKSHKHDANLQKNSSLYFQIGLILCLLGTYALFEMKFENKVFKQDLVIVDPDDSPYFTPTIIVEPNVPPKADPIKKPKEKQLIDDPIIVDNDTPDVETPNIITDPPTTDKPINPNTFEDPVDPSKNEKIEAPFNLNGVEVVPVYPGCEKKTTNGERIKCMNEKITKLVQRKFDTDLAGELGLSGTQRINVQFKIDKNGNVSEILTRAPHPSLEKEAERVTNKIPQMEPGLQREQPVSVLYNLPIVFKVN